VPESLRRLLREYFDFVTNLGGLLGSHNPMRTVATATVVEALEVLGIVMEPEAVRARLQARGFSEPLSFDAFSSVVYEALSEIGLDSSNSLSVSPTRSLLMARCRRSARDSFRNSRTRAKTLPIEELARNAGSWGA